MTAVEYAIAKARQRFLLRPAEISSDHGYTQEDVWREEHPDD